MRRDPDALEQRDDGVLVQPAGFGYRWRDYYLTSSDDEFAAHVVPVGDSRPHLLTEDCPCRPQMNSAGVWLHRAWDRREMKEEKGWLV